MSAPKHTESSLPCAQWVVATTAHMNKAGEGAEWPLIYRIGYQDKLDTTHTREISRLLQAQTSIAKVSELTPLDNTHYEASYFIDVAVADPQSQQQTIAAIKQVARPEIPYTALVIASTDKLPSKTGKVWVGIRDTLDDSESEFLERQLETLPGNVSVYARGRSSFELRLDYRLAKTYLSFVRPLSELGIMADFWIQRRFLGSFEQAFNPEAGF